MNLQRLVSPIRWLHVYLTMLGFGLMCLFAVTGVLLNHRERLGLDETETTTAAGTLPADLAKDAPQAEILQELGRQLGLTGTVDTFEVDDARIRIVFERPGTHSEAMIDRSSGMIEVNAESAGLLGILADLHRGHGTNAAWSVAIDVAAVLLFLSSVTGMALGLSLARRRGVALVLASAGLVACACLAWLVSV
ncbi:MAG TPA: PepSY-associated TM helix domain-containing protein [Phycisphaerae bacterium]|nr:PepSY-associated TM helix domain-containing protein [Phycisphaerae bacterium]HRY70029.1 PepSY-associated TM helix domain-containing protein [Phycisphaerae bacterium]HSA27305.1 PepSY-associated TM helix domain-containing protein [Phycisphaerae bacterium]